MTNVLIDAYTRLNLGDDLFVKVLCERYPKEQFTIATRKEYAAPFEAIENLKTAMIPRYIDGILSRLNINYRVSTAIKNKEAQNNEATVIIGGSIFIEPTDSQSHIKKNQELFEQSQQLFILGSNFGPYQSKSFYNAYEKLFSKVKDVCFRDASSYHLFDHLPTVRTAPDVVFSMDTQMIEKMTEGKYVVISVIDLSWRDNLSAYQEDYEQSILQISEKLIEKGYKVLLMSFCKYEGDEEAIERILSQTNSEYLTKYFYAGNIDESLEVINGSSGVIATRFHSMILGWMFNKPVFPFVYSNKTLNVLNDKKYDGYYLEIEKINTIDVNKAVTQTIYSKPTDIDSEMEKAQENFLMFDQFMASKSV